MRQVTICFRMSVMLVAMLMLCAAHGQTNAPAQTNSTAPAGLVAARTLLPNDEISVTVYQEPDLEVKKVALDANGMVPLPLLGSVKLVGLTVPQATACVRDLYDKDYLVEPTVSINVVQFAKLRFTVLGEVQQPGSYDYPPNETLNLLECLAIAQGYTRLGSPSKVTVQRQVDGKIKVFELDARAMGRDKQKTPFQIRPDDIITVGERVF